MITKGTKRRLVCVSPVEAVIGIVGPKSKGGVNNPSRYGTSNKVYGYQRAYGSANRFAVKTKNGSLIENISAAKRGAVLAHRAKFKAVGQNTRLRLADPTKRQLDEAAWKAQTQYATLFGFVFKQEWQDYED